MRYFLRSHSFALDCAKSLTDAQLVEVLSDTVLNRRTQIRGHRSEHDSGRVIHISTHEAARWNRAVQELPKGYSMGDVLDRLTGAPEIAQEELKSSLQIYALVGDIDLLRTLWDSYRIPVRSVIERCLEGNDPEPTDPGPIQSRVVNAPHALRKAFQARGWSPVQQAIAVHHALTGMQLTPSAPQRSFDWGRVTVQRRTADLLRGMTWVLGRSKEEIVKIGLAFLTSDSVHPVPGKRVQIRFRWSADDKQALHPYKDPSNTVELAIRYAARGHEQQAETSAGMHKQCWPRG